MRRVTISDTLRTINKPTDATMLIGTEIKLERIRVGMRQEDLADKVGINKSFLSRIENNHEDPSLKNLIKLLECLALEIKFQKKIVRT